jgi:flagellar biosynthesis/type III secretory pathway M-ring protein FliF/YscJ
VTLSETIKESSSKDEQPVGIPGSEANLPEQAPEQEASSDEKFQQATNYEYSQIKETTVLAPGAPEKVNVSVLVNTLALQSLIDASGGELGMADLQKEIQIAVEAAVGYSTKRGDTVKVSYIPFKALSTDSTLVLEVFDWEKYAKYAIMLLVISLVFFFIVRPLVNTYNLTVLNEEGPGLTLEELAERDETDGSSIAMARRLRRMVDNFETIDSQELNHLVEMHEQPTAEVLRRWLRAS